MPLLLDTHTLIWWLAAHPSLSSSAADAIASEPAGVFVSAATAWEIATKFRIGKLPGAGALAVDVEKAAVRAGFRGLAVTMAHGQLAGSMAGAHRDPFDRMLMAQALIEGHVLVSNERVFDSFGVTRLW